MIEELIIEGDFKIKGRGLPKNMATHLKYLKLSTRMQPIIGIDSFSSIDFLKKKESK